MYTDFYITKFQTLCKVKYQKHNNDIKKTHFCKTYMGLSVEVNLNAKWTRCDMFEAVAVVASPSEWAVVVSAVYWRVMYFEVKNADEAAGLAASASGVPASAVAVCFEIHSVSKYTCL